MKLKAHSSLKKIKKIDKPLARPLLKKKIRRKRERAQIKKLEMKKEVFLLWFSSNKPN